MMHWGWLLLLALPMTARADGLGDAYKAFEKGQYEEAAKGFQSHTQQQPQDYDQLYNTGVSLFRKGDYAEASNYFDRAKQSPDPKMKSRSAYNKGVAMGHMQRWDQAEAEFQEALSYDNDNTMIQDNLRQATVQKKLQKEKKPEDRQKGDSNPEQQNQESNPNGDKQVAQQDSNGDKKNLEKDPKGDKSQQDPTGDRQMGQKDPKGDKSMQDPNGDSSSKDSKGNMAQQDQQQKDSKGNTAQPDPKGDPQQKDAKGSLAQRDPKGDQQQRDAKGNLVQKDPKGDKAAGDPKGEMQLADPAKEREGSGAGGSKVLTIKDLKKQEAEKLLRSVDDRVGTYILTPEQANTEGKSRNGKDW